MLQCRLFSLTVLTQDHLIPKAGYGLVLAVQMGDPTEMVRMVRNGHMLHRLKSVM